jgi:hypothetical protein
MWGDEAAERHEMNEPSEPLAVDGTPRLKTTAATCSCPRGDFHNGIDPDCIAHGQSPAAISARVSNSELTEFKKCGRK